MFMVYGKIISKVLTLSVLSLLLITVEDARGGIYGYRDSSGKLVFSNSPKEPAKFNWIMSESGELRDVRSVRSVRYEGLIHNLSVRHGVDPNLVKAMIKTESDFDPMAVSEDGALGLMQLMPETARDLGVKNPRDPVENIDGGVRHLRRLMGSFKNNLTFAIAAYNAGEGSVRRHGGIPPFKETKEYVKRVLRYYERYRGGDR